MPLTKRQKELLQYITRFYHRKGYMPSYREIKDALKYNSTATIALHINGLIERGYLKKTYNAARSLELVDQEGQYMRKRLETALKNATDEDRDVLKTALGILGFHDEANRIETLQRHD